MQFTEAHRNTLNELIDAFEWIKDEALNVVPDFGDNLIEKAAAIVETFDLADD